MSTCLSHFFNVKANESFYGCDCSESVFDFTKQLEEIFGLPRAISDESMEEFLTRINKEIDDNDTRAIVP